MAVLLSRIPSISVSQRSRRSRTSSGRHPCTSTATILGARPIFRVGAPVFEMQTCNTALGILLVGSSGSSVAALVPLNHCDYRSSVKS